MHLEKESGTWKWGVLCLLFLAPFFFLSYGFANQYAAQLADVPSVVYAWEQHIPLWPWTIVPYWSIDLLYGLSLLLCWNKFELKQHALRLFFAQLISISCFLLFPLKFSFERPELTGFFGLWFDVLMGFDKPFNQAPSLHIVLLVILWDFYRRHSTAPYKWLVDLWSFLIGLSVLTTWQHHFIDIPTGLWVGALCLWLFPVVADAPFKSGQQRLTLRHLKLAAYYAVAAIGLASLALILNGTFLWLAYPALSLILVALAYITGRVHFFQKHPEGTFSTGSWILFAPYLLGVWLNSRIWTRLHPQDTLIIQLDTLHLYLGRLANIQNMNAYDAVFDCCAEFPTPYPVLGSQYLSLDLIPLQANQLEQAVMRLEQLLQHRGTADKHHQSRILIFCALGYARSSATLCAWLLYKQYVTNSTEAIALLQQRRPWVVLNAEQQKQLNVYQLKLKGLAP